MQTSSLSLKCSQCALAGEKCVAVQPAPVDFDKIDRAMKRLEQEEIAAEAASSVAVEQFRQSESKLRRLRKQKKFLKDHEKRLFDKDLSEVEKFERLEELEKADEVQQVVANATSLDAFFSSAALTSESLLGLDQMAVDDETLSRAPGSSSNS